MKKLTILTIIFFLFAVMSVAAIDMTEEQLVPFIKEKSEIINQQTDKIPGVARALIGDERINVMITKADGTLTAIKLELEEEQIKNVEAGSHEKPTIIVKADQETVMNLLNSDNKREDGKQALADEKVDVVGVGFFKKMKIGLLKKVIMRFL